MIWIILFLGLSLRIISLDQSLWLDEAINVLATKNFSLLGMIAEYATADFHPPGYFIILWFWTKIFGTSEWVVRIPSVIFGVLTIYLIYKIGTKLQSKSLGLISALLLAVNPLHIYYSQEARMYGMATLAVAVNSYFFIKLIKGEKVKILFLLVSNLFVLSTDYVAYLIFPSQLILIVLFSREKIKEWMVSLVLAILLSIWWLPIFLKQLGTGVLTSSNLPQWKSVVGGFDPKAVPLTLVKFIIGRISYPDKNIYALILLPIITLFLWLFLKGYKYLSEVDRRILFFWVGVPLLLGILISTIIPIYSYFRVLFVIPAIILVVSAGILSLNKKLQITFLITLFLIEIFSTSVYLFNKSYQREDWKGFSSFIKERNAVVYFESSGLFPPFEYYSEGKLDGRPALKNFPARSMNDITNLDEASKNLNELYLAEYLVDISDPNKLVSSKLEQLGYKIVDIYNFTGIGFVYRYVK